MYADQCPLEPFIPIFLIVFGISLVIVIFLIYLDAHLEENWTFLAYAAFLFLWAWVIAGQFTAHIVHFMLSIRANKTFWKPGIPQMRIRCFCEAVCMNCSRLCNDIG